MSDDILTRVKDYLSTVERGETGEALAGFLASDVVQEEFPNRVFPAGARRGLREILDAALRGQRGMAAQRYELLHAVVSKDEVVLEVQWIGKLAVPLGTLAAGAEMRARLGVFLEFRDGKIAKQRNYDCYDAW